MKTDLFPYCSHCSVFQVCWHIECRNFTASSFRILNNSVGISSPPLDLFVVMFPNHPPLPPLTLHSRMPGSRRVFTPPWLSGSLRSFVYRTSVYSCHLFLISSASLRSILSLSFIVPTFAWNVPLVSLTFLKRSLVFPTQLFSSILLDWSLNKAFLSPLAILWNSAFRWVYLSFSTLLLASLFSGICKASSGNHFAFLHFFFLGMVLITASCTMSRTSVLSAFVTKGSSNFS